MLTILLERPFFETIAAASLKPKITCPLNRDACRLWDMDAALDFTTDGGFIIRGGIFRRELPRPPLAFLILIIDLPPDRAAQQYALSNT
jgi:hypothetical protein